MVEQPETYEPEAGEEPYLCIADTHFSNKGKSLCGQSIIGEAAFTGLDHWFNNARNGGFYIGCRRCVRTMMKEVDVAMMQPTVAEATALIRAHLPPAHGLLGDAVWDAAANEWRALVQMDGALVRCGFTISACCTYSHVLTEGS